VYLLTVVGVVASCSGAAPSPSASTGAPAASAASLVPAASSAKPGTAPARAASPDSATPSSVAAAAGASAAPTALLSPSGPTSQHDPELEARLPDTFHGVTLSKLSFSGSEKYPVSIVGSGWMEALAAVGKTAADVSFASATSSSLSITFQAFRVKGADASVWSPKLVEAFAQGTTHPPISHITVGGRPVIKVQNDSGTAYALASGDALFIIATRDETLVADAVAALP
jgi:hypothetical protein